MADKTLISELQGMIDALQEAPSSASSPSGACEGDGRATAHEGGREQGTGAAAREDSVSDAEAAFRKIVALVNVSDRSEKTIRERLQKAGFREAAIEQAVARAKDYRFIDDLRFAAVLARSRIAQGRGMYGIEREFIQHGIDPVDVPGWPRDFEVSADDEFARAMDVLEKKPPRSKNLRDGAFRKLVQRGFSVSASSAAARAWADKREGRS